MEREEETWKDRILYPGFGVMLAIFTVATGAFLASISAEEVFLVNSLSFKIKFFASLLLASIIGGDALGRALRNKSKVTSLIAYYFLTLYALLALVGWAHFEWWAYIVPVVPTIVIAYLVYDRVVETRIVAKRALAFAKYLGMGFFSATAIMDLGLALVGRTDMRSDFWFLLLVIFLAAIIYVINQRTDAGSNLNESAKFSRAVSATIEFINAFLGNVTKDRWKEFLQGSDVFSEDLGLRIQGPESSRLRMVLESGIDRLSARDIVIIIEDLRPELDISSRSEVVERLSNELGNVKGLLWDYEMGLLS